jgi:hypothetical protein
VPRGFTLKTFDVHPNSYRLVYQRADGATIFFSGATGTKQRGPAEKKPRGLFQKLAAAVSHVGSSSKGSNKEGTSGEYEARQTSVKADNRYAGIDRLQRYLTSHRKFARWGRRMPPSSGLPTS